jgi:hypothetical protein
MADPSTAKGLSGISPWHARLGAIKKGGLLRSRPALAGILPDCHHATRERWYRHPRYERGQARLWITHEI